MKIVADVLGQMTELKSLSVPQRKFLQVLFSTMLIVRGKVNFLNLSRYCALSERTLRRHFRREFNWPLFNRLLVQRVVPSTATPVVALDASFVKKSGKKTFGIGYFFNGCAGRAEKGLEVSLVSLIDVAANTAYALSVRQTMPVDRRCLWLSGTPKTPETKPAWTCTCATCTCATCTCATCTCAT